MQTNERFMLVFYYSIILSHFLLPEGESDFPVSGIDSWSFIC